MSVEMKLALLMPVAYVLGSVPFGLLVGLARGVDVREAGSKNIGATNVGRLLGGRYFALVFTLDLLKSFVPMVVAAWLVSRAHAGGVDVGARVYLMWLLVGFSAVAGHMFSVFLKFKGGKGVATSAGLLLGMWPYFTVPGLCAIGVFVVVFWVWRYVSLGSMLSAGSVPVFYVAIGYWRGWDVLGRQLPLTVFGVLIALLVVWKHRTNIQRLRAGTEHRFVKKAD